MECAANMAGHVPQVEHKARNGSVADPLFNYLALAHMDALPMLLCS